MIPIEETPEPPEQLKHLYLTFKTISLSFDEEIEIHFSIYSYYKACFITESYIFSNLFISDLNLLKTIFKVNFELDRKFLIFFLGY